jgi:phosphoserine phosphatase
MSGVIAIVFDFDDTLAPDSTTKLLASRGVDPGPVWQQANELVREGYDQPHAYLRLLLDMVGEGKPLGRLTNADLSTFGATLDDDFYPGLPDLFEDLRAKVSEAVGMSIEFFIVSAGLEDVIRGSGVVQNYCSGVYGCLLAGDQPDGELKYIRRAVTFTEKTRFLFEINKGLRDRETLRNPYLVNRDIAPDGRPVPWENMIYIGDGLTDIPCFSLVEYMGGKAFGVLHGDTESGKNRIGAMLGPRRARSLNSPRYSADDDFGLILRQMVAATVSDIQYRRTARA